MQDDTMPEDDGIAVNDKPFSEPEAEEDAQEVSQELDEGADDEAEETDGDNPDEDDESGDEEVELSFGGRVQRFSSKQTAAEVAAELQRSLDETWSAHTRRSQEVAEQRKAIEARAASLEKIQQYDDEAFKLYAHAQSLTQRAAQAQQRLAQIDPYQNADDYRILSDEIARSEREAQRATQALSQREQAAEQERRNAVALAHQQGAEVIRRQIRGFDPERVIAYAAKNYGIDADEARNTWGLNPASAIAMHKAMMWDEMQAKARKRPPPQQKQAAPVRAPRSAGRPQQTIENMPIERYHEMRMKQRRGAT